MHAYSLELNINTLVSIVLAIQFAAFGWRINREIPVGDMGRKTWFPIPDIINILSMLSVVWFCVVLPLASGQFSKESRVVLSVAFVLVAFHPICLVGHYRLFTSSGRHVYTAQEKDFPYCTGPELVLIIIAIASASAVGLFFWSH